MACLHICWCSFVLLLFTLLVRNHSSLVICASILLIAVNVLEAMKIVTPNMILYLPIIANEVFLAIWLIVKGFDTSSAVLNTKNK